MEASQHLIYLEALTYLLYFYNNHEKGSFCTIGKEKRSPGIGRYLPYSARTSGQNV
jgi:hypothetical protein